MRKGDTVKKSALGGILAVTLVLTVLLLGYLFLSRTSSGYRIQKHQYAMSFFEDRIGALEKQRDLLEESASSLEEEAALLRKRIGMLEVEVENMRARLRSEKEEAGTPFYSWGRFRFTTSSMLIVIAFLVFIWLLYSSSKNGGAAKEPAAGVGGEEGEPLPGGSVLEEEFPPSEGRDDTGVPGETGAAGEDVEKKDPVASGETGTSAGETPDSEGPGEEEGSVKEEAS